jgi:hypothetical protein
MGVVALQILEPANGATFTGPAPVRLRGQMTPVPGVTLFPKWYSSLEAPNPPGSPIPDGGSPLDFTTPLGTGTHVISFTVKDVAGDDKASLQTVTHAGMAGGPVTSQNPSGCLIHVFTAEIVAPALNATVSKAAPALTAVAPRAWGRRIGQTSTYEPDQDYHARNQLRVVWRFAPFGAPAGRASALLTPALAELRFDPAAGPKPVVVYTGTLPGALGTGAYDMTLRVEFIANPAVGHEATRRVSLTA